MRFVLAIVAFVVAAGMIAYGIAQRTVLAPDDRLSSVAEISDGAAFTVIDGSVLNSNPGQQRLAISGSDAVFAAYARTADVMAWLGEERYNAIGYDSATAQLSSTTAQQEPAEPPAPEPTPAETSDSADSAATLSAAEAGPSPEGSDLWLEEHSAENAFSWTVSVPDDISVIIASDGTAPAPSRVELTWPVSYSTPWAGPLIIGGGVLLLLGLFLYIWGLVHMRRTRGPRRKSPPRTPRQAKLPSPPKYRAPRPAALAPSTTAKGRRSAKRSALIVGALLTGSAVVLSGCSSLTELIGTGDAAPTPSPSLSDAPAEAVVPVAVTVPQLERIVARISKVAADADADLDVDKLKTRFTGPALSLRTANYKIRKEIKDYEEVPLAIPAGPLEVRLPEASDTWPRTVFTVVNSVEDETVPPIGLFLIQDTPRDNYRVHYSITLEANTTLPEVAPAAIGATRLSGDNQLLAMAPEDVAAAYGDILNDAESEFLDRFDEDSDQLRGQVGVAYKKKAKKSLPSTASITFAEKTGTGEVIAMATNDSGAIVATSLSETTTVKPVETGASVNASGGVKALVGTKSSESGFRSTYGYQLLFYVPPVTDDTGKVVLLGYSQGLISAKEL